MEYQFNDNFLWGAASSGPQSEGTFPGDGKAEMEWDYWFKQVPEHYYNMILMDVQMPKMDGYESTRAIRALDREDAASVPIIAMTANAFAEDVQNALHAGMTAHFAKPIDASVLEQMLYKYLR